MTDASTRVLILGGTGMLGHAAVDVLARDFEVHATVRDPDRARRLGLDVPLHALDGAGPDAPATLDVILAATGAEAVVNCVGLVKQLEEASRPVPAITLNALFPHQAAEVCAARGARLIHVSTDCVFSGDLAPPDRYGEDDLPDCRDLYGRSKLLGEVVEDGLTLRTSIIGWELERASGLLEWLAGQAGGTIRGFANAWFSGLTTRALAAVIGELIADHPTLTGLYQVSTEPISKLDLVTRLDRALGLDCTIEPAAEPRVNRALDSTRFRAETGIEIPSWDEMIDDYATHTRPGRAT